MPSWGFIVTFHFPKVNLWIISQIFHFSFLVFTQSCEFSLQVVEMHNLNIVTLLWIYTASLLPLHWAKCLPLMAPDAWTVSPAKFEIIRFKVNYFLWSPSSWMKYFTGCDVHYCLHWKGGNKKTLSGSFFLHRIYFSLVVSKYEI